MDGINSINNIDLYNDFRHLGRIENVTYRIDNQGTQFLEIRHPDNFFIDITVPDGIFEWFIEVLDNQKNKLVSDWDECYGEPKEALKTKRQKAIEELVQDILNHKLRFFIHKRLFKKISTLQLFKNNEWTN